MTSLAHNDAKLAEYLVQTVIRRGTGRSEEYCIGDRPRDRYFIGSLAPASDASSVRVGDLLTRLAPTGMGLDVLVRAGAGAVLVVKPEFNVYYRIFPTLEQQLKAAVEQHPDAGEDESEAEEDLDAAEESRLASLGPARRQEASGQTAATAHRELATVFRKVSVPLPPIRIPLGLPPKQAQPVGQQELQSALVRAITQVQQQIAQDPQTFRQPPPGAQNPRRRRRVEVPPYALESEQAFGQFLASQVRGEPVIPQWEVRIEATVRPSPAPDTVRVSLLLRNESPPDPDRSTDHFIFDPKLTLTVEAGEFRPFQFWQLPQHYRYDASLPGFGQNCVVEWNKDDPTRVWTETAPIHAQKKYVTRDWPGLSTRFADLAENPVPVLKKIASAMEEYYDRWQAQVEGFRHDPTYEERTRDLQAFHDEIRRFKEGIGALQEYPLLHRAFCLMNEVFRRQGQQKGYHSWRLFQLVYIVMIIPDLAAREYPEKFDPAGMDIVDVLWFQTGGGKTETYLGLAVFAAFFDRLRGKKAGVTAWTRFPLRLLSLQQLQRIADVFVAAELLRQEIPEISGPEYDPFTVGYLVGKGNTPNNLVGYNDDQRPGLINNPKRMQRWKIVTRCPYCGSKDPTNPKKRYEVKMELRCDEVKLVHVCQNPACQRELPIYVVDNEIYRYLPTMVIGTVDKLASVGNQRRFSHLFGAVTHKCPVHGYLSLNECTQRYACKVPKNNYIPVDLYDPSPSLQIQDELHLLREGLGVFNAHYETFVDTYQQKMQNGARQKIIAATATIEEYRHQVYHLYRREARRFPAPGPEVGESFYAQTLPEIRRFYVGIMPHQKSHINAIIDTLLYFHEEIQRLRQDPVVGMAHCEIHLPVDQFLALLDKYEVSLTYVLSMREGDRLTQSIRGQLSDYLARRGLHRLENVSLTGNTPFDEVGDVLERLEQPEGSSEQHLHAIVATSMISHGVDVARLNYMVFYGMPRQTAEYIQSSSRVGRTHVGIAMVLFNPARERDQSHYHFFNKYHEFLDMLVEPVPINRWSKFSVQRTVPGLFMGLLLNYFWPLRQSRGLGNVYFSSEARKAIERHLITYDEVVELLKQAYGTSSPEGKEFELEIQEMVRKFFHQLSNPIKKWTSETLNPQPMTSLRDVDVPISIRARGASDRLLDILHEE